MEDPLRTPVPDLMEDVPALADGDDLRIIETLGWHPDDGMRHAGLHLARMGRTAAALGFRFDHDSAAGLLAGVASLSPLRCRMELRAGGLTLTTSVLPPVAEVWRVAIAQARVRSDDPWLRYKTSRRALYDDARKAMPADLDELLFLNERGEVCEGTISNIFVTLRDGTKATPPLTCGLLPGILRQTLLARDHVERVLMPADLASAQAVHLGNALRGLIRAEGVWLPGSA